MFFSHGRLVTLSFVFFRRKIDFPRVLRDFRRKVNMLFPGRAGPIEWDKKVVLVVQHKVPIKPVQCYKTVGGLNSKLLNGTVTKRYTFTKWYITSRYSIITVQFHNRLVGH